MKINYVITRSDVMGGASVHLIDLAVGAQKAGHDVEIFVGGKGILLNKFKNAGLKYKSLKYMQREINPCKDFLGFLELRKIFKKNKPDLVHLHSSKAGILGRIAAKSLGIPTVFTAHGWAFTEGVSYKRRKVYLVVERFMAKVSNKIITVSEFDRQLALYSKVGNEDLISTVHNGMPNLPKIHRSYSSEIVVKLIMVARFDEQKDYMSLIQAVNHLDKLNYHLELVGDGPLMAEAKVYVEDLDLTDFISFSGACNDVAQRLAISDVFLLISNWEGLPLTILEAMRAGLPVIASNVGGVSEAVVDADTGFLVPRGDSYLLAEAINKLLNNEELRLRFGNAGRKKFDKEFSFQSMLTKTLDIYAELIDRKI